MPKSAGSSAFWIRRECWISTSGRRLGAPKAGKASWMQIGRMKGATAGSASEPVSRSPRFRNRRRSEDRECADEQHQYQADEADKGIKGLARVLMRVAVLLGALPPACGRFLTARQVDLFGFGRRASGLIVGAERREAGIEHRVLVPGAPAVDIALQLCRGRTLGQGRLIHRPDRMGPRNVGLVGIV